MHYSLAFAGAVLLQSTVLCQRLPSQLTPVVLQTFKDTYLHAAPLGIPGHSMSGLVV